MHDIHSVYCSFIRIAHLQTNIFSLSSFSRALRNRAFCESKNDNNKNNRHRIGHTHNKSHWARIILQTAIDRIE